MFKKGRLYSCLGNGGIWAFEKLDTIQYCADNARFIFRYDRRQDIEIALEIRMKKTGNIFKIIQNKPFLVLKIVEHEGYDLIQVLLDDKKVWIFSSLYEDNRPIVPVE